ncbi:MAG: aminopeptidase P family protein [Planctomycetaceae bacterium]|nr:aminopeptidase P family protein [Planctomycetaceae bacterium]
MTVRKVALMLAGIPATNMALYRRIRFSVGDPAACIELPGDGNEVTRVLILRDIEMERARKHAQADRVACPADYSPEGGLSGDRETATAQAAAECVRRAGMDLVRADRSLPLVFVDMLRQAGIAVEYDPDLGVLDRRAKDAQEIAWIREAQAVTEGAMEMACRLIARADVAADGTLVHSGETLTAERVRAAIDHWLLDRDYVNPPTIVAGGREGADCHNLGTGPLRTGEPVIIDIFPRNRRTLYNGDCTRTVVHGHVPEALAAMHRAVCQAKAAAEAAVRAGVTGESVHRATIAALEAAGYPYGIPPENAPADFCSLSHGTGHGLGLDVHEPPLLDMKGPELVVGDVVTVEPGLYRLDLGGVRVEDVVVVTAEGCENINHLPEGIDWA